MVSVNDSEHNYKLDSCFDFGQKFGIIIMRIIKIQISHEKCQGIKKESPHLRASLAQETPSGKFHPSGHYKVVAKLSGFGTGAG